MNKAISILFFSLALASCVSTYTSEDIEPRTYPLQLSKIINISITHSGMTSPAVDDPEKYNCSDFVLSAAEVNDFFNDTMMVHENDYRHMLDWSPCYIEGRMDFSDGTSAVWAIHQFKAGSIVLDSGETVYLYCPNCKEAGVGTP